MSDYKKDRAPAKPSGKRYDSVEQLMASAALPPDVVEESRRNEEKRQLTLQLAMMRTKAGVTQAEVAKRLGVTQGAVSKLENGYDDDVTVKHLRAYAEATKIQVSFAVGLPLNRTKAIKLPIKATAGLGSSSAPKRKLVAMA